MGASTSAWVTKYAVRLACQFCFKLNLRDRLQQVLRLGNVVPDFTADSTHGPIEFHNWIDGHWAILFSHPADFTVRAQTFYWPGIIQYHSVVFDELVDREFSFVCSLCAPLKLAALP